jgi:hypothetical protein
MPTKITLNPGYAGGVYVLNHGKFITCLGFDVVLKKAAALAREMNIPEHSPVQTERGTMTAYRKYAALVDKARQKNIASGWRSRVDLTADLIGLEGKRVEVIDSYGGRRRFIVGRSTGWIPCHLEIKCRRSLGGEAVWGTPFSSVRIVGGDT